MEFKAVKSYEFKTTRQWMSGFPLSYERKNVWRVQITIGQSCFTSNKTYSSEENAKKAAKRMTLKQTL